MLRAMRTLILAGAAVGLGACGGNEPADQNYTIDDVGNSELETLPADESSTAPAGALVNGTADEPGVVTADNQTDSY